MSTPPGSDPRYAALAERPEFVELRRRYLRFVVPATITFMAWYILYVAANNWARGFMNIQVVGHVNVAVVFGLLQFVSTFGIAVLYARYSTNRLDPLAAQLNDEFEAGDARHHEQDGGVR
ncbi:DUF485 domain-containing protein [Auraticoccus monumenti]|uniref:Uncharacterized membrane protein, DUF485 family n=1 Tax=Auraticoccus monumenti TaxID=675864 RepID=A0A1G7ETM4_9ACTN|nr:DUF485 domain-containing protein [Auraticoccus monumenti]SDE66979.1 Uncharacterized membrane protein, DUF485 family [Auraticoccus monumenti]